MQGRRHQTQLVPVLGQAARPHRRQRLTLPRRSCTQCWSQTRCGRSASWAAPWRLRPRWTPSPRCGSLNLQHGRHKHRIPFLSWRRVHSKRWRRAGSRVDSCIIAEVLHRQASCCCAEGGPGARRLAPQAGGRHAVGTRAGAPLDAAAARPGGAAAAAGRLCSAHRPGGGQRLVGVCHAGPHPRGPAAGGCGAVAPCWALRVAKGSQ